MGRQRQMAHHDLRHFSGGVTAGKDIRVGTDDKGLKPKLYQMLNMGGKVRQTAGIDTRMGRAESVKPATRQPLFKGGPARAVGRDDIRMGKDGESKIRPGNMEMLSDGGEADEEEDDGGGVESESLSEEQLMAAADVGEALAAFGRYGDGPMESDSKIERASKEASRKAKAEILGKALKAFFLMVDR